jgi:acetyl-CoA/propionyl-CoA carboxylase, biotin carboxylase, biotin carboxyl carrier protein
VFKSILIANRGEIAVRIIRAAREMGIRTIAVFSEADKDALWTRLADEAHLLGPAPARESYLDIARMVQVARQCGAEAVHPGYGLLSESAEFAQAVLDGGIAFVGPRPDTIALMGDKVRARQAAIACGIPVLPGSPGAITSHAEAFQLAAGIGWPLAVKASFGGGGRGMRVAAGIGALTAALEQAAREAASAFGRGEVFLERYLVRPRHVEVQVLGDARGNIVHLGTRDCSVQRRHQKLVEEAPAFNLPEQLRARLTQAALTLCRSVKYQSAGTVEFLVDVARDAFYFLEMNTRLQVEHGVTELVTGIDLVRQQILIAVGHPLMFPQNEVRISGHAMQARIAAEDPWEGFRPVAGRIGRLSLPLGPWLRLDFGMESGDAVQPHYDSMFGKIQSWGHNREEARCRLTVALGALVVEGVPTTAPYLHKLIQHTSFVDGTHDTGSLERDWQPNPAEKPSHSATIAQAHVSSGISERRVSLPWGGKWIDCAVFGIEAAGPDALAANRFQRSERRGAGAGAASNGPVVTSPMDAVVITLAVKVGQPVTKGAPLLVLEAMKMEVIIPAPHDGIVDAVFVIAGETVKTGAKLAALAAAQITL